MQWNWNLSRRNEAEKSGNCEIKIGNIKFIGYRKRNFKYPQTNLSLELSEGMFYLDFKIASDTISQPHRSPHTVPLP